MNRCLSYGTTELPSRQAFKIAFTAQRHCALMRIGGECE
jgi:hypothetical protein